MASASACTGPTAAACEGACSGGQPWTRDGFTSVSASTTPPGDDYCERWGIRGAHGNAAAYAVRHLGKCVAPEAIDVPYLSAVVTVRRLRDLERRYGKRTAEARAMAWRVGVGR